MLKGMGCRMQFGTASSQAKQRPLSHETLKLGLKDPERTLKLSPARGSQVRNKLSPSQQPTAFEQVSQLSVGHGTRSPVDPWYVDLPRSLFCSIEQAFPVPRPTANVSEKHLFVQKNGRRKPDGRGKPGRLAAIHELA